MNLAKFLFKPKWRHKDASVRRTAVVNSSDTELLAALPQLIRNDANAEVRLAALRRLDSFEIWRERSTADTDSEIRRVARERYLNLFANAPGPVEPRLRQLVALEPAEIERIAQQAIDPSLRTAALQRIERQSVLIERALNDPDATLRQAALRRINDPAALARIAEKSRKTDKTLNRLTRERLEAMQIAAGDTDVITHRARTLCERLETQLRDAVPTSTAELETISKTWSELGDAIPNELRTRYAGARYLLEQPISPIAIQPEPTIIAAQNVSYSEETTITPNPFAAKPSEVKVDAETSTTTILSEANQAKPLAENQRARELQRALLPELETLLKHFASTLESGNSADAHQQYAQLGTLKQRISIPIPSNILQLFEESEKRYKELSHWQRWSNTQRRQQLCDAIEALPGSGLHPDALALKIREARKEWEHMEHAEGTAAKSTDGQTRRFRALCHQALKPAQPYFEKRDELRKTQTQQIQALLERCAAVPTDSNNWKQLSLLKREASTSLQTLHHVDPRERIALAKRLKDVIATFSKRLQEHEQEVERSKNKLIEQAQALSDATDSSAATRQIRELQKLWRNAGNGRHRVDQTQWSQFRNACDAVFDKLDAVRQQRSAQEAEAHIQAESILNKLENLNASFATNDTSARLQQRELEIQWRALNPHDRALQGRYHNAIAAIHTAHEQQQRLQRQTGFIQAHEKYTLLRTIETGVMDNETAAAHWMASPTLIAEFETPLAQRYQRAGSTANKDDSTQSSITNPDAAKDLLVQLEFLAGLESPETEKQRRMDYQIIRLSARLQGNTNQSIEQELADWLRNWFALPTPPINEESNQLDWRFKRALHAALALFP